MDKSAIKSKMEEIPISEIFNDIFSGEKFEHSFRHGRWDTLVNKILGSGYTEEENAYINLFHLLYTLEGPFSFVINSVIWYLIKIKHHDLWTGKKFVTSFNEIFEQPLNYRLKFLTKHDFQFFSDICPRLIRNSIAHQSYTINPDGSLQTESHQYSQKQIKGKIDQMIEIATLFIDLF